MPFPLIPMVATGGGILVRQLVKYAWGPLVVGFGHLLKSRLGLLFASAMLWMGINYSTLKIIIEPAISMLEGLTANVGTGGTGAFAVAAGGYVGIMQIDRAVTMIVSAVITRHAVNSARLFLMKTNIT